MTVGLQPRRSMNDFEEFYRETVRDVSAYFARRSSEPQVVADLTQETYAEAIASRHTFDQRRGNPKAWLFGIARHVYFDYCAAVASRGCSDFFAGTVRELGLDETDELVNRIDAEEPGRRLLERCATLSEIERAAIELVDLTGLKPVEAASVLGVAPGTLRIRLYRARSRLREGEKE